MAGIGPVIGAVEVEEEETELEGDDAPEPNSSGEGPRLTGNPVLVLVMYAPRRRASHKTVYISYTQSLPLSLMPTPLYDAPPRKVVIPTVSPPSTTFEPSSITIHPTANAFADSHGRTIFLRGINVSGDAKYPMENPVAGTPEFYDASTVTYVGKPFPSVDQASEWWTRLRAWGIGIVRMVITWEALEPRKMGEYDEKYIDYIYAILERAHQAGLMVFIDGHQDVWSRFTGGSGAPMWTFHMVGLDPSTFPATCAAALDVAGVSTSHSTPSGRLWPTNYSKFGPATMFTVFYAGEVYAPKAVYSGDIPEFQGENIGYVLRSAYIKAYAHLASRLSSLPNVLGYDPMNEPHPGYIALPSLHRHNENTELHLGHMPSALQSMELAAGLPTPIGYFERTWPHPSKRVRDDILNKERISAWLPGRKDIWLEEGVYILPEDKENGKVTLGPRGESYFATNPNTGRKADFEKDFYVPFLRSYKLGIAHALQDSLAGRWMFVEPVPNLGPPAWAKGTNPPPGEKICYSPHWYDIRVLYEKALWYGVSFDTLSLAGGSRKLWKHTYIGRNGLTANYADNFQRFISHLKTFRPEKPTPILIGETGIPFDMNLQSSYITGDIHIPLTQLDAIFHGMEKSLLNWTVWNLTLSHSTTATPESTPADNETSAPIQSGDNWNSEDFSLVSLHANPTVEVPLYGTSISPRDLEKPLTRATLFGDLYLGGRLLPALLRPYPAKTAGIVINSEFFLDTLSFELRFIANPPLPPLHEAGLETTTEIFVPVYHFSGRECILTISVSGLGPEEETAIHKPHVNGRAKSGIEWTWDEAEQDLAIVHDERHAGKEVSVALRALVPGEVAAEKKNWAGALVGMFV